MGDVIQETEAVRKLTQGFKQAQTSFLRLTPAMAHAAAAMKKFAEVQEKRGKDER